MPLYLFLGVLANDAVSAVLALWDRVHYPSYASTDHSLFNLSPLDDQAFAGALMWVFGTLVYLFPAVVITTRLLSPSESSSRTQAIATLSEEAPQPRFDLTNTLTIRSAVCRFPRAIQAPSIPVCLTPSGT
jgi:hypothetical protein